MTKMSSALYLLPIPISETESQSWIGLDYRNVLTGTTLYFVENIRTARRFISSLRLGIKIDDLQFEVLDKDTNPSEMPKFASRIQIAGKAVLMSEAGCPAVADPGSLLVNEAHKAGIRVLPFVGPSSIILALMGSGLSGQNFCFHGYLPVKKEELVSKILKLEQESKANGRTQIFIETPYRNGAVWTALLERLNPGTSLCFALDILGNEQRIVQKKVADWKMEAGFNWPKKPAVFLFMA
jgi:16S rRNA (cytidine1402-2'-O)-methyltransferase